MTKKFPYTPLAFDIDAPPVPAASGRSRLHKGGALTGVELMMKNFSWKTLLLAIYILFPHSVFAEVTTWHASLDAYPEARIVLKIPQTEILLYVESDGKSIVALKGEQTLWKVQPFQENSVCDLGAPVIRDLRFERGKLQIVFCKHSFGEIDLLTGQYRFLGQN